MSIMKQADLLNKFKKEFQSSTKVKVADAYVGTGNWFKLEFDGVNCEQLANIAEFIKNKFSEKGNFRHKLPTVRGGEYGYLVLSIDEHTLKEVYK